ncbi:hypothetical protein EC973_003041 [Apophysomyces ossiformis]|uniref:Uncharacterized protein n=1 Tax=Apophysomyces ossiformis TaxID=679940 RepID=A0A8H7ESB9_9FUNG|nr:hypothetical protein EC973_003041 [Apophysomyces ossiformis]
MITPAESNPNAKVDEPAPSPVGLQNVAETAKPIQVAIQGHIPDWVHGVLYRSGAGRYNLLLENGDTFHIGHPFDGMAMLHRFEIHGNQVLYSSRHTSRGVERRIRERDPTLLTFGPDPCKTIFGRIQSVYHHLSKFSSNAKLQESDPEFDMVNVTITPNFPLGERLQRETGVDHHNALVVKRDANTLQLVDGKTLEPLKMFTYGHVHDKLQGQLCASHHQQDDETGEYVNFMVRLGPIPSFQVFFLDKVSGKPRLCEPIYRHLGAWKTLEALKPAYIHSFSMTERYVIVPHFPYYYSFGGLSALYYSCAYQTFYWDETRHTLFHVIDRASGRHIATYEADPCFSFHSINAWDELVQRPGQRSERVIYMDYCTYENTDIIDASFELGKTMTGTDIDQVRPARFVKKTDGKKDHKIKPSEVRRYRLGQVPETESREGREGGGFLDYNKRRTASYEVLGYDVELPRINPRNNLKRYRYVWGVCESRHAPSYASGAVVNGLIKLDLDHPYQGLHTDEGSPAKLWDEKGCSCSEPIFIPHPHAEQEDEGVILSTVNTTLDGKESCFLLVLDAATMTELGRGTVGNFNAMTIHGSFVDQSGYGVAVN